MYIEQIYTGCLAEAAYYVESEGEVAIIDPMREIAPYVEKARERGAKIKYIFETHFHADFVSGHVDLAAKTGAKIIFGPTAKTGFESHIAEDNEVFPLGKISLTVLHTPGHTLESSTFLLKDENQKDHCIFTGDTLFIGDVGRPDLAVKSDLTKEDLAGLLFESLHNKIMPLADELIVYPAHGAGSSCGKNLSSETFDTLGNQKKTNYALKVESREAFIKEVTTGILPPPQYFPKNAVLNKSGYDNIDAIIAKSKNGLELNEFLSQREAGNLVLDTRHQKSFSESTVPGAVFIGLNGSFAGWVGTLIEELETPILLITDPGKEEEAIIRLARVGYSNVVGYLIGGFETWEKAQLEIQSMISVSAETLAEGIKSGAVKNILDVRKPTEYQSEHVIDAETFPLDFIMHNLDKHDKSKEYYVHCKGGYRSVIAASILIANGYKNIIDVEGGMAAILKTEAPVSEFVCPSTL